MIGRDRSSLLEFDAKMAAAIGLAPTEPAAAWVELACPDYHRRELRYRTRLVANLRLAEVAARTGHGVRSPR